MYVNWSDDEALACEAMRMPRLLGVKSQYFSSSSTKYCKDPGKLNSGRRFVCCCGSKCEREGMRA